MLSEHPLCPEAMLFPASALRITSALLQSTGRISGKFSTTAILKEQLGQQSRPPWVYCHMNGTDRPVTGTQRKEGELSLGLVWQSLKRLGIFFKTAWIQRSESHRKRLRQLLFWKNYFRRKSLLEFRELAPRVKSLAHEFMVNSRQVQA